MVLKFFRGAMVNASKSARHVDAFPIPMNPIHIVVFPECASLGQISSTLNDAAPNLRIAMPEECSRRDHNLVMGYVAVHDRLPDHRLRSDRGQRILVDHVQVQRHLNAVRDEAMTPGLSLPWPYPYWPPLKVGYTGRNACVRSWLSKVSM